MDKFDRMGSLFGIQPDQIKEIAEAFAAVNPEKDGRFVGSITFKTEGGRVTFIEETKIVRAVQNEPPVNEESKA